jgi:Tfp pilus assembly protein PilF
MSSVALSMIVKNAEKTLEACLDSVAGIVQEIDIADTGSTDSTVAIAEACGAKVITIPWENDFGRARNRALEEIHSEWVLALDADEVLDPAAAVGIPPLLARSDVAGYLVPIHNYVVSLSDRLWDRPAKPNHCELHAARNYQAYVEHENVRLFRRLPGIQFVGRVHETVGPSILGSGRKLGRADFIIHHFGLAADADTRARKNTLYRGLGREKVREMPENAQAHFELGLVEFDNFHNDAEALKCFERSCQLNPRLSVAWLFCGLAHLRLGKPAEALTCLKHAEGNGLRTALAAETQGDAFYNLGDFESARRSYRRAVERGGKSASAESKLGLAEVRLGRTSAGLDRMRHAIETEPKFGELYDRLVTALVWLGRLDEAAEFAERRLAATDVLPASFLRAASIRAQRRNWQQAEEVLQRGLERFPSAEMLHQAITEVMSRSRM